MIKILTTLLMAGVVRAYTRGYIQACLDYRDNDKRYLCIQAGHWESLYRELELYC
jgi:hypothetical protein